MLAERLIEQPGLSRDLAISYDHLDPLVPQNPESAPRRMLGGILGGDHDPSDAGGADGVSTRAGCARDGSTAQATRTALPR